MQDCGAFLKGVQSQAEQVLAADEESRESFRCGGCSILRLKAEADWGSKTVETGKIS